MTMETAVVTATNPDTFEENGVPLTKKASMVVEDRPSFNELQSIERHRREILLRVSLFNTVASILSHMLLYIMHTPNICNLLHIYNHDIIPSII